jgi:hypothetical protein
MKAGGLFTAIGVLAVLGGYIWWSNKHPTIDPKVAGPSVTKLMAIDPSTITEIHLNKKGTDPIVLKKISDVWQITEPKQLSADSEVVSPLSGAFASLNSERLIDDHPTNLDEFGLKDPAEEVDVTTKNGKTEKLLIGSDTPTGGNVYAKMADDPKVYTITAAARTSIDKSLNDLRDKRMLTFNQNKLVSVTLAAKGAPVEFKTSPDIGWHITKPQPLRADGLVVDDLVRKLNDAKMDLTGAYDPKAAAADFNTGAKIATVTATDDRGAQTLEVRQAKDKSYYAKSSVVDSIYKITTDIGDGLNKSLEDFRSKKLFDFNFDEPTKLEINGQVYEKADNKWTANKVQMDWDSIQSVTDKMRDLAASKLVDKTTAKPADTNTITLAITSGEKHRFEKVVINKNGDEWDAQREGEPTVYVVDAKNRDELQKAIAGIRQYTPAKTDDKKK